MLIYNYSPSTGAYLGTSVAREDPMESGRYLIPANATATPAPALNHGETAIFDGDNWRVVPDYRGRSVCGLDLDGYYTGLTELTLGETPDARRILADPPAPGLHRARWNGQAWIDGRTTDEILASYEDAIEARLDQFAQSRGYRHGDRLASYRGSSNATWAAEADRFIGLREATWTKFISISADVTAGKRAMPTLDDLLLELPELTWDADA